MMKSHCTITPVTIPRDSDSVTLSIYVVLCTVTELNIYIYSYIIGRQMSHVLIVFLAPSLSSKTKCGMYIIRVFYYVYIAGAKRLWYQL